MGRNLFGVRWISAAAVAASLAFGGLSAAQAAGGQRGTSGRICPSCSSTIRRRPPPRPCSRCRRNHRSLSAATVTSEHDTGYKFGGVLGYHLDSGIRIEGEIFLARAEIGQITNTDITLPGPLSSLPIEDVPLNPTGTAEQFGAMLNIWYDFDTGSDLTPYIGGGLGFIRIDQGDLRLRPNQLAEELRMQSLGRRLQHPQATRCCNG